MPSRPSPPPSAAAWTWGGSRSRPGWTSPIPGRRSWPMTQTPGHRGTSSWVSPTTGSSSPRASARWPWDHAARAAWLNRQAIYDAGPYEQAARVFREHGYTAGAEAILIAQRRHARRVIAGPAGGTRAAPWTGPNQRHGRPTATGPRRVLWLLAILLILVIASLEAPPPRRPCAPTTGRAWFHHARARTVRPRRVRRRVPAARPTSAVAAGALLQPGSLRHRHRGPARLTSTSDRPGTPIRPALRRLHAMVAECRHVAGLAALLDLRAVPGPPLPRHVSREGPRQTVPWRGPSPGLCGWLASALGQPQTSPRVPAGPPFAGRIAMRYQS